MMLVIKQGNGDKGVILGCFSCVPWSSTRTDGADHFQAECAASDRPLLDPRGRPPQILPASFQWQESKFAHQSHRHRLRRGLQVRFQHHTAFKGPALLYLNIVLFLWIGIVSKIKYNFLL